MPHKEFSSSDSAASALCSKINYRSGYIVGSFNNNSLTIYCGPEATPQYQYSVDRAANPAYDPAVEKPDDRPKSIPLTVVADKVISNAENGDADAQAVTRASADAVVQDAVNDKTGTKARPITQQLEQSPTRTQEDAEAQAKADTATGTQTQNPDKPNVTDLTLEFPAFCGWASIVCEAAQVAIGFPATVSEWVSEAKEFFTKDDELPNEETKVDITDIPTPELQENAISWGASCPADVSLPISMQGVSSTIVFSWSPWCQLLSIIKPAIVASAYIGAAFIVLGLRT